MGCGGGDRRGGEGQTLVFGRRSDRDPHKYCGINRNRLCGEKKPALAHAG
jgi:hypothetical protein